ncbi:hypothetical protein PYJP_18390 [Pyrofollis japonicus]|nr:hypothetical protein PYJP_18390 [Pyrofollis japonicus]
MKNLLAPEATLLENLLQNIYTRAVVDYLKNMDKGRGLSGAAGPLTAPRRYRRVDEGVCASLNDERVLRDEKMR